MYYLIDICFCVHHLLLDLHFKILNLAGIRKFSKIVLEKIKLKKGGNIEPKPIPSI